MRAVPAAARHALDGAHEIDRGGRHASRARGGRGDGAFQKTAPCPADVERRRPQRHEHGARKTRVSQPGHQPISPNRRDACRSYHRVLRHGHRDHEEECPWQHAETECDRRRERARVPRARDPRGKWRPPAEHAAAGAERRQTHERPRSGADCDEPAAGARAPAAEQLGQPQRHHRCQRAEPARAVGRPTPPVGDACVHVALGREHRDPAHVHRAPRAAPPPHPEHRAHERDRHHRAPREEPVTTIEKHGRERGRAPAHELAALRNGGPEAELAPPGAALHQTDRSGAPEHHRQTRDQAPAPRGARVRETLDQHRQKPRRVTRVLPAHDRERPRAHSHQAGPHQGRPPRPPETRRHEPCRAHRREVVRHRVVGERVDRERRAREHAPHGEPARASSGAGASEHPLERQHSERERHQHRGREGREHHGVETRPSQPAYGDHEWTDDRRLDERRTDRERVEDRAGRRVEMGDGVKAVDRMVRKRDQIVVEQQIVAVPDRDQLAGVERRIPEVGRFRVKTDDQQDQQRG